MPFFTQAFSSYSGAPLFLLIFSAIITLFIKLTYFLRRKITENIADIEIYFELFLFLSVKRAVDRALKFGFFNYTFKSYLFITQPGNSRRNAHARHFTKRVNRRKLIFRN